MVINSELYRPELRFFRFINLKPGTYRVRCYVGDRYVSYDPPLHVRPAQPLAGIDFRFAPFKKGVWQNRTFLDGLISNTVYAIASDGTHLWFGTRNGVSRYDGKQFTNIAAEDGLVANWIETILIEPDGTFWFGSSEEGISRYDGRVFTNLTRAEGLPANRIRAIVRDDEGISGSEHLAACPATMAPTSLISRRRMA